MLFPLGPFFLVNFGIFKQLFVTGNTVLVELIGVHVEIAELLVCFGNKVTKKRS